MPIYEVEILLRHGHDGQRDLAARDATQHARQGDIPGSDCRENADPAALIGDKAYDADPFIDTLSQRGITPVIPPRANRATKRACDFALYCERNLVERFFNQLKHFRAIATRYDKLARNFLAGAQLAAAIILLN